MLQLELAFIFNDIDFNIIILLLYYIFDLLSEFYKNWEKPEKYLQH